MTIARRSMGRRGGLALAAVLLAAAPAFADDAALRQRIEDRLGRAGLAQHGQVEVEVSRGAAVLSGFTATVAGRREAEKAARKETKQVENRLRVVPEPRTDEDVRDAVVDAVLGYAYYGVFDSVGVGVTDGVVTLQGSVRHPYRKRDIDERVARLDGVRAIRNEIRVQPVSGFDDRLRHQLYHQIYGDSLFQRYATFADPPIHIVVENGHITLTGIVSSRVEKVKLESIARGTLAFRVDNQVEVEGERGKEPARKGSATS